MTDSPSRKPKRGQFNYRIDEALIARFREQVDRHGLDAQKQLEGLLRDWLDLWEQQPPKRIAGRPLPAEQKTEQSRISRHGAAR